MKIKNDYQSVVQLHTRQLPIVFKSLFVGVLSACVVVLYRLGLTEAEAFRNRFLAIIESDYRWSILLFFSLVLLSFLTGWQVRRYPLISGSGIPQVKGQIKGLLRCPWRSTLIAKFLGGLVTGLAGLSLGREGPSIQLGSSVAQGVGDILSKTRTERKILIASGAAAGLAAAFNAPLAGVIFVFEEIFRYISPVILLSTLTAAVSADYISKLVFGFSPVFNFTQIQALPLRAYWLVIALGLLTGVSGAIYNWTILKSVQVYRLIEKRNKHLKFLIPFIAAGILGLTFPIVLGGGHPIIEQISVSSGLKWLLLALALKFIFSVVSFGSGSPGGIFFPLLVLGALIGAVFSETSSMLLGIDHNLLDNFLVLAMAGYFSAIVRAPITGIVLLTEMTGSFQHMLPLTVVSLTAYVTAELCKSEPIYDALLANQVGLHRVKRGERDAFRKITFEVVVQHGSPVENKPIRELSLPEDCLVIAIRRHGLDLTPKGDSVILAEDQVVILTNVKDEPAVREALAKMTENEMPG